MSRGAKMSGAAFDRRAVLCGAGGVVMGLPWLERFAHAQAAPPQRLVLFKTHNGTSPPYHTPSGTGTAFTFNKVMEPLEPFKRNVVVVSSIDNTAMGQGGHGPAAACGLTGRGPN